MRRRSLQLCVGGILCLGGAGLAWAQGEAIPTLTADLLEIDFETQEAVYRGGARAEFGAAVFLADEIRWDRAEQTATALGNAVLQRGDLRLLAETITYHLATESYRLTDVRLGRDPYFFSGDTMASAGDDWIIENATLFYGEPGAWTPSLRARSLTYNSQRQRIKPTGGRVGIGAFNWLPLPNVNLPLDGPDVVEITVDGGGDSRLGMFGRIGATVPVNANWRAGADLGIFTNRGVMAGPAFGYDWVSSEHEFAHGRFTSGYIHDSGDRGDLGVDVLGDPISADRGLISWQHVQAFSEKLTFHGDLNYWNDSEVLRDFRSDDFFPIQVPDNFWELTFADSRQVAGVFLRAQPNDFHVVRERLPELSWELLPQPLVAGFLHQAQTSAVSLRDDLPTVDGSESSQRFDLYYALSRPWTPNAWLAFTPMVGGRLTHYADAIGGRDSYTRELFETGFDAEVRFSGTFDYQNERWNIDGLRHLITPRLSYRYIPDADEGAAFIPQIDRRVFATYLEPLALGARRQIDDLTATDTLRFSIDQRLQTRDSDYGSRDLVQLNLAIDSRFDRTPADRTLSALHSELRLSPASFLDFDLYHRATPGDWTLRELNAAVTLHDADLWQLQFASHYLKGDTQEFIGSFAYRFNEVWQGYSRLHFDSRRSRFVEQSYGLRQTIANRWAIGYEISFFEGPRRESDFGFAVRFDAVTF